MAPQVSLAAIAATLLLVGCVGVHQGRPESRGVRSVESRGRVDAASAVAWRQIEVGHPPKATHVGYLKTEHRGALGESHWVYDGAFTLVGRVSPRGKTVRITLEGREVDEGNFALEHALLRLFGYAKERAVHLEPMPDPRG